MGRLSGKTAVITGAGSGIGRASSLLFAAEGASLVIADKMDSVNETAKLVAEAGGKAIPLVGDAGEEGAAFHGCQCTSGPEYYRVS